MGFWSSDDNVVQDPFGYDDPRGPHCCGCEAGQYDGPNAVGNPGLQNPQDDDK